MMQCEVFFGEMTGWLASSVVECSHGQRNTLGSSHNVSPATMTLWNTFHDYNAFICVGYTATQCTH